MIGKATLYAARCAPRKARLLRGLVVGQPAALAVARLAAERRAGAHDTVKLLRSALSQISSSYHGQAFVQDLVVNEGPKRKMFMPRAQGRATPVLKRTSHLTVVLAVKG